MMREVTVTDVLHAPPGTQVIDVREHDELASGMIPGAVHLPMSQLGSRIGELDRTCRLIVVCRSGNRSASVANALSDAGFTCDTMRGGMVEWSRHGLPISYP